MRGGASEVVAPPLNLSHLGRVRRQPQCYVDARNRSEDVGDDAMTLWVTRDFVEHDRRIAHSSHIDVYNAADLLLRLGAGNDLEFARGPYSFDPVPQILVGHLGSPDQFGERPTALT